MNFARTMLLITGIAAAAVTPSLAQSSVNLEATVPWGFNAGATRMPAGQYVIKSDPGSSVVRIQNTETKQAAVVMTNSPIRSSVDQPPMLTFHKYGTRCYLASVTTPDSGSGRRFGMSKAERETAKAAEPFEIAVVRAHINQ